eukprot:scaffold48279_cov57-Attheya_sp.AAC.1
MISSRSSRNSSSTGRSMLATVCSSALLLIAFLGNHHVADAKLILNGDFDQEDYILSDEQIKEFYEKYGTIPTYTVTKPGLSAPLICNCAEIKDPCTAMLNNPVVVRATLHRYDDIQYTAIVETVFVNAGAPSLAEGQTIEIRDNCVGGVPFPYTTGDDMILGLFPSSNGDYFTTEGCGLNSPIDSNGVIRWTEMGNCFTYKLRLKGQSYNAAPGPPAVGLRNVPQITPTLTKEERQEANKLAKEAKKAARQAKKAEKKALKKAQRKD